MGFGTGDERVVAGVMLRSEKRRLDARSGWKEGTPTVIERRLREEGWMPVGRGERHAASHARYIALPGVVTCVFVVLRLSSVGFDTPTLRGIEGIPDRPPCIPEWRRLCPLRAYVCTWFVCMYVRTVALRCLCVPILSSVSMIWCLYNLVESLFSFCRFDSPLFSPRLPPFLPTQVAAARAIFRGVRGSLSTPPPPSACT